MDILKISNSEIQAFKDCRRKWYLNYYRELAPKKKEQTGIRNLGIRVHTALYEYYVNGTHPRLTLARLADEDMEQLTELDDLKKFNSEIELAKIMVDGYLDWLAETGVDSELELISGETYMEREFTENAVLMGKIDARFRHIPTGTRWILDHKTVDYFEDHTFNLTSNEQMMHYLTLEEAEGEPCAGALYNMLRKVKRSARATPPFYMRREIRYNKHQLRNFQERLRGVINDIYIVRKMLDNGVPMMQAVYPRPSKDCSWKCDFRAVCPLFDDGSRAEDMLAAYYEKTDPHAHYGAP